MSLTSSAAASRLPPLLSRQKRHHSPRSTTQLLTPSADKGRRLLSPKIAEATGDRVHVALGKLDRRSPERDESPSIAATCQRSAKRAPEMTISTNNLCRDRGDSLPRQARRKSLFNHDLRQSPAVAQNRSTTNQRHKATRGPGIPLAPSPLRGGLGRGVEHWYTLLTPP
jgi:hypothetical protein